MAASRQTVSPPQAYQADTNDLARFIERGRSYRNALASIEDRVAVARRRTVEAIGTSPAVEAGPTLGPLLAATLDTTQLASSVRHDLLTVSARALPPALGRAVRDGRLPPPDDAIRNRLLEAVLAGATADQAGIDPAYLPPEVARHQRLRERIAGLEADRRRVDGHPLVWWDGDDDRMAAIDRRLARLGADLEELADVGIEPDGSIDELDAIALIAETTDGLAWEGRRYAEHFGTDLTGPVGEAWHYRPGLAAELAHVVERVAAEAEVGLAFHRQLGPAGAARLPTLAAVAGEQGDGDADDELHTLRALGESLAAATHARGADGGPSIGFGGAALVEQPMPDGLPAAVGRSPATLLAFGRFDPAFLADATVATLRLGHAGDRRGSIARWRWDADPWTTRTTPTALTAEDPRNILLAAAAANPEAARLVVRGLLGGARPNADRPSLGSSDRPPRELDPLIRPTVPFDRAVGAVAADRLGHVDLDDPYPITTFLGTVAADPDLSRAILGAVAEAVAVDGPVVGDVGTAAGLDLMLARHASTMLAPATLAAVRLPPSGLRRGRGPGVAIDPPTWRAVGGEVVRWGRGQALAAATEELLHEAIAASIDDAGAVDLDRVRPFAQLAGRVEAESWAALFARSSALDDEARRRNRDAGRAMALLSTGVGFVPWGWTVAAPASVGWAWFFEGSPTDEELQQLRLAWGDVYQRRNPARWQRAVVEGWLERRLESAPTARVELVVPGLGPRTVDVRWSDEHDGYRWRHPEAGDWRQLALPGDAAGLDLLPHDRLVPMRRAMAAGVELSVAFQDGIERGSPPGAEPGADTDVDAGSPAAWTDRWLGRS